MKKPKTDKRSKVARSNRPEELAGIDADIQRLTEEIIAADREILSALADAQTAVAREVMARRRRALRDLAK